MHHRDPAAPLVLATVGSLAVLAAIVFAPILGTMGQRAAGPASPAPPTAAPAAVTSATPGPSATPLPPGTYENLILGYRVTLPETYRLSRSVLHAGQSEFLGRDVHTSRTEAEERADCLQDAGHLPSPTNALYLHVAVYRNVAGRSALEWTKASPYMAPRSTVEPTPIGGLDAAKLASKDDGKTEGYVISANDRIYVLGTDLWPTPIPLDNIAATFVAIPPGPFPTPTPAPAKAPREAAHELGEALGKAFAARNADAIARLMPDCWIGVSAVVEPVELGSEGCCFFARSVPLFVEGLRARFAKADLTVTIDPEVQVEGGSERYFVRSTWTEPGRTTSIDLFLDERDGRWQWTSALHHYQRTDLERGMCVKYGSPWVSTTASC